ncbi:MAG: ABC transporter permease, partial [Lachnospiraceae bacterium]|nr:ABC transporter permease [Lachnospiraceae bacterium]
MKHARKKKHMLTTMTLREIRNTFGRFFAVFAIIGIGVGFFSGVRITTPVMINTVNSYYQENQLYDYRAVSTLGWEDSEVAQLSRADGVRYAEG